MKRSYGADASKGRGKSSGTKAMRGSCSGMKVSPPGQGTKMPGQKGKPPAKNHYPEGLS